MQRPMTLVLDSSVVRGTPNGVMLSGWMKVVDELPHDTAMVLNKLQEGTCEPWLAPRHEWMLKNETVYAYFDNVENGQLWTEHDKTAAIAEKGIAALERIIALVKAIMPSASYSTLAESADCIRDKGIPIIA